MSEYVIATTKSWNMENAKALIRKYPKDIFFLITDPVELNLEFLKGKHPKYIFFPHWSWIIPEDIYNNYECVVFHMTDLPFGRGGSPLQNLLVREIYETKITSIRVEKGLDTGGVYFKEPIDISSGNADEILKRVSKIIFETMIPRFIHENLRPTEQNGEVVVFSRRRPEQSEIPEGLSERQIYDYIRMLDGEGYPTAFIRNGRGKVLFSDARFEDGHVTAKARFVEDCRDE